jgi:hypothetical protein
MRSRFRRVLPYRRPEESAQTPPRPTDLIRKAISRSFRTRRARKKAEKMQIAT